MKTTNHHSTIDTIINFQPTWVEQNFPQLKEEEFLEIEAQDMDLDKDTTLVLAKEKKSHKPISLGHILQSLFYAIQWPQLKRQMTKEAVLGMTHRHWSKTALGAVALLVLFNLDFGKESPAPVILSSYAAPTAVSASVISHNNQGMLVVSEEAKANYIARFKAVAETEMQKYGIPASITLGLAILHSNYGVSPLAQAGHNHFHVNCNNNPLAEGISGREMHDGVCYVYYQNAWTSFRANSMELSGAPYQELKKIAKNDYKIWVSGLQKFGYPQTDKLLEVIEQHQLYQFDKTA